MNELVVNVSDGMQEYASGTIKETLGVDIASATIKIGLGGFDEDNLPTAWEDPGEDTTVAPNKRHVGILIDSTRDPGVHWAWVKIIDNPEVIPIRIDTVIIVK